MKEELYGICREVGESDDRVTLRLYESNFLIDVLIRWQELSKENDLLDGSWFLTVYKVDPNVDTHAKFARFDFVATDLFNYDEKEDTPENDDPMYCCVCHLEREDVNEEDICPDCENPIAVVEVLGGVVTDVHGLDTWVLLDWDSFEGGACPYCFKGFTEFFPETGPVVWPHCNGEIRGGDWTQEQQIAHARQLRSGRD